MIWELWWASFVLSQKNRTCIIVKGLVNLILHAICLEYNGSSLIPQQRFVCLVGDNDAHRMPIISIRQHFEWHVLCALVNSKSCTWNDIVCPWDLVCSWLVGHLICIWPFLSYYLWMSSCYRGDWLPGWWPYMLNAESNLRNNRLCFFLVPSQSSCYYINTT